MRLSRYWLFRRARNMLARYSEDTPLRIVGIDPGTDTLGASVLDVSLVTGKISIVTAATFRGSQMAKDYEWIERVHGSKAARLKSHEENLLRMFHYYRPHEVVCETPYMGRFPAAYAALIECVNMIRSALMQYDDHMPLLTVDPPNVKKAFGVSGKSGDKGLMREALIGKVERHELFNTINVPISMLDEHAIDSIAVAYVRALYAIQQNQFPTFPDGT